MSTPPDSEFPQLRRLLAIKRYEQPPAGFFEDFSGNVIEAVRSVRSEDARADAALEQVPWLYRLLHTLQARPAFGVAFGAAVCALLLLGLVLSGTSEPTVTPVPQLLVEEGKMQPTSDSAAGWATLPQIQSAPTILASTNPMFGQPPSLFDQIPGALDFQTAPAAIR